MIGVHDQSFLQQAASVTPGQAVATAEGSSRRAQLGLKRAFSLPKYVKKTVSADIRTLVSATRHAVQEGSRSATVIS